MSLKTAIIGSTMATPITANSDEACPQSGIWKVIGSVITTKPVAKGEPMPKYCGKAVKWELLFTA